MLARIRDALSSNSSRPHSRDHSQTSWARGPTRFRRSALSREGSVTQLIPQARGTEICPVSGLTQVTPQVASNSKTPLKMGNTTCFTSIMRRRPLIWWSKSTKKQRVSSTLRSHTPMLRPPQSCRQGTPQLKSERTPSLTSTQQRNHCSRKFRAMKLSITSGIDASRHLLWTISRTCRGNTLVCQTTRISLLLNSRLPLRHRICPGATSSQWSTSRGSKPETIYRNLNKSPIYNLSEWSPAPVELNRSCYRAATSPWGHRVVCDILGSTSSKRIQRRRSRRSKLSHRFSKCRKVAREATT